MSEKLRDKIKVAARRVVRAEVDHSWKGQQDAVFHASIEAEKRAAWGAFNRLIDSLPLQEAEAVEVRVAPKE